MRNKNLKMLENTKNNVTEKQKNNDKASKCSKKEYNWLGIATFALAVISFVISLFNHKETKEMSEKYNRLSTYNVPLNYTILPNENIESDGEIIMTQNVIKGGRIRILPHLGGVEKVYGIHCYNQEVEWIYVLESKTNTLTEEQDAHGLLYDLCEYGVIIREESEVAYYGTLFLIIKDYLNNYYPHMLICEYDKNDIRNVNIRVYSEVDFLYLLNNGDASLPYYDYTQLLEFKYLVENIEQIL